MERLTDYSDNGYAYIIDVGYKTCEEFCKCVVDGCKNCYIQQAFKKLATYEDLEEQGLLVRLPVKIETELFQPCADRKSIIRSIVINNTITDDDIYIGIVDERGNERHYSKKSIGKTVFLTREEAENKLKEMKKNG